MFLNELTDFGPGSDDITGTASELPAMEKCAVQLCFGWTHAVENAKLLKLQKENGCVFSFLFSTNFSASKISEGATNRTTGYSVGRHTSEIPFF